MRESERQAQTILCLEYNSSRSMFELTCSFHWSNDYHDCIVLRPSEEFEGYGHEINITGENQWEGLFRINESATGLRNVPVIRNVHIFAGETSVSGGFIVQSEQENFIVESCTIEQCYSLGSIAGSESGATCIIGRLPGHNSSNISILNCFSRGSITASGHAGGICGPIATEKPVAVVLSL